MFNATWLEWLVAAAIFGAYLLGKNEYWIAPKITSLIDRLSGHGDTKP